MELQKWKIFQHLDPIFAADVKRAYLVGVSSLRDDDEDMDDEDDEEDNSPYTGGVIILRNDDVYFITRDSKDLRLRGERASREFLPFVPVKIEGLCGQKIRAINSGAHHVVALTTAGRIFQWGHIYVEEKKKIKFKQQFLTGDGIENKRVIQIACGEDHSLALTSEGEVFTWGSNRYGQLGTGRATYETNPTKVSGFNGFESKISTVACSGWNSFALDKDGSVWSWGDNDDCLGYDAEEPQIIPLKMPLLNVKMVAAGNTHAIALTDKRELVFWGQHASDEIRVVNPRLVEVGNVATIGATRGSSVSACKTTKGKVYYWGVAYGHFTIAPLPTRFRTIAELFKSLDTPIMMEPLTFDLRQRITEKLKLSFDDKESGDVRFKVEGKVIYAHSMILKIRSDHFTRMFDHNWKENDEKEVEIADFTYQGFRTFLLYLYTDRIDPPPRSAEDAIELFKLADYYGEEDLKGRCEQQLKVLITEGNVSKIYAASFQYNTKALHDMALDFIIPNLNDVVKTEEYRKMSDDLKNRLIQELAEEHVLVGLKRKRKN